MSAPFFSDDKGNILFGLIDPTRKFIKDNALNGDQRGISPLPPSIGSGGFPAPLINPNGLNGSLGDWMSTTPNHFLPYPGISMKTGFTSPENFADYEYSSWDNKSTFTKPGFSDDKSVSKIKSRTKSYNYFEDYSSKQFTHLLDYFIDQNGLPTVNKSIPVGSYENGSVVPEDTSKIHLGSFIKTTNDNEDPTMLGYDVEIKLNQSPLFNGSIDAFISQMSSLGNSEISSRKEIYEKFKSQFFKFIKNDSPVSSGRPVFDQGDGTKTYYLKSLGGLNGLVESNDSSKLKSFVDYGNEFITLGFYEDVTQNIGYLASLYKSLSWSRINGKQIIPENLLRFDVDITITEVRKYNRVFQNKSNNEMEVYSDLISKYTYSLYECQFFFQTLPHGDSIDMTNIPLVEKYEIKFNYKYATMKFTKFQVEESGKSEFVIDNKFDNISTIKSNSTNANTIRNGSIVSESNIINSEAYVTYKLDSGEPEEKIGFKVGDISIMKKELSFGDKMKKAATQLGKDLTNAVINETNRRILTQAALLNKTLDNIRNSIPYAGRMSAPRNVYTDGGVENLFKNDVINAARGFVGNAIKGFFTKP